MYMEAFLFGVTVAIAIGPIALLIVNASITRGLLAGLACGAGAALADLAFALLAFHAGTALMRELESHRAGVALGGSVLLAAMGFAMIAGALRQPGATALRSRRSIGLGGTFLLTIANPFAIAMFAAWISRLPGNHDFVTRNMLAVTVFIGSLLIQSTLAAGGSLLRPLLARGYVLRACNLASGTGIALFGLVGIARMA